MYLNMIVYRRVISLYRLSMWIFEYYLNLLEFEFDIEYKIYFV